MPIGLKEKQAIVAEVNETANKALSAVMADYRGVSVDKMTSLRQQARGAGVHVKVIRNTLAKRAFEGTEFECLNEALLGPNILKKKRKKLGWCISQTEGLGPSGVLPLNASRRVSMDEESFSP